MRMSCNGCRVLRKGCSDNCSIRPCLQWITSPDSQANATVFLAKFYGRAGLLNLINAAPHHLRPAVFRSLLYEACGRIVNPIYGSVGLLWSGSWQLCQAAVEAVLKGEPIIPINSDSAAEGHAPPLKAYDIRHVSKDENSAAASNDLPRAKTRCRVRRVVKPKPTKPVEPAGDKLTRSTSHDDSSLSHQSELGIAEEGDSMVSVETGEATLLFRAEPLVMIKNKSINNNNNNEIEESNATAMTTVGLELTLGMEPAPRGNHVVPVKKRRVQALLGSGEIEKDESCKMELGLP